MTPFYLFFGVLIIYLYKSKIDVNKLKGFVTIFLCLFVFSPFAYAYVSITNNDKRTDYKGKKISQIIEQEWKEYSKGEFQLSHVIGDEWIAGNLSYHLKTRPKWHNISTNTLLLDGGFIIINRPDLNCNYRNFSCRGLIKIFLLLHSKNSDGSGVP